MWSYSSRYLKNWKTEFSVISFFGWGSLIVRFGLLGRVGFAAIAAAVLVAVARAFGFATQGFQLVPRLDFVLEELGALALGQGDDNGLLQGSDVDHLALAQRSNHLFAALGQHFAGFDVLLVFVDQAAAQAAAHAGDLAGVQRDSLGFGHLDRDGTELGEEHGAAARLQAAGAHAAQDLGDVPRAYAAKLHPGLAVFLLHILLQLVQVSLFVLLGVVK